MSVRSRHILTGWLIFGSIAIWAQQPVSRDYFRSPVDGPISLSGTFGEIRTNHFHSGIDYRTGGVEGKPVYASAGGYVARVFVSPAGFGKALYIAHPSGYTTVYGHLKSFSGAIGKWVRTQQYSKESFAVDLEVPPGLLPVKKGEIIGLSGNSGSSAGPHLHFEIRDSRSQEVLDPLSFGLPHKDTKPPRIHAVKIYPVRDRGMVNFSDKAILLPVTGTGGIYHLKVPDTIMVSGDVYFGLEAFDYNESSHFRSGIHSVKLSVDNRIVYSHTIKRFAFSQTRYVNAMLDYPELIRSRTKIMRSFIEPGNGLKIYSDVSNQGIVYFSGNQIHKVVYEVSDLYDNKAVLIFRVKSHQPPPMGGRPGISIPPDGILMDWNEDHVFERKNVRITVPAGALFGDLDFVYTESPPQEGYYAGIHAVHNRLTPLFTWCTLAIRPSGLPEGLKDKAVVVYLDEKGGYSSRGGKWDHGMLMIRMREFGDYSIRIDTVAPVIKPVNVFSGKNISKQNSIQVKISDDLSGIATYRGTLNGKWILMDYDEKNRLLHYHFDERLTAGKNEFVLSVADGVGNRSTYRAVLIR